jgi:ketosteroid isomerase-like protein
LSEFQEKKSVSNTNTVQEIYGAFGAGDVPRILGKLADSVEWDSDAIANVSPFLVARRGMDDVGQFFAALAAADFTKFEPTALLESGNTVVALIDVDFTVKATGKSVSQLDEVHIWRFGPDGKVVNFRHRVDTHAQHLAFAG